MPSSIWIALVPRLVKVFIALFDIKMFLFLKYESAFKFLLKVIIICKDGGKDIKWNLEVEVFIDLLRFELK